VADTIRGRYKVDIIRDLASGELNQTEIANKYDISVPYVSRLKQQWSLEIEAQKNGSQNPLAALWIADLDKRVAEYEAIYEQHEEFTDPKSTRIRLDCLRAVSELLGQLPQRMQQAPSQVELTYKVEGVDMTDVV
jgi:hypothetical protein